MLRTVTATNYVGDSLEMDLWNPYKSGFLITNIEGLSSPEATINTTEVPTNDGSVFNSSRLNSRNLVLTIRILDTKYNTIEQNRLILYKHFPAKRPVTLKFVTDTRSVKITGYVESNEVGIFSDAETSTISIMCPVPYFEALAPEVVNFSEKYDHFEFPSTGFYHDLYESDGSDDIFAGASPRYLSNVALETINTVTEYERDFDGYYSDIGLFRNTGTYVIYIPIEANTTYTVRKKTVLGDRLRLATSTTVPSLTYDDLTTTATTVRLYTWDDLRPNVADITTSRDAKYLLIYTSSTNINVNSIISNIIITKRRNLICMSDIVIDNIKTIPYHGDVETGCVISIHAVGPAKNITVYNMLTRATMTIKMDIQPYDDIVITTIKNRKSARLLRHGVYTSILNKVTRDSEWFILEKGDNIFGFIADSGSQNLQLSINSTILYEGI